MEENHSEDPIHQGRPYARQKSLPDEASKEAHGGQSAEVVHRAYSYLCFWGLLYHPIRHQPLSNIRRKYKLKTICLCCWVPVFGFLILVASRTLSLKLTTSGFGKLYRWQGLVRSISGRAVGTTVSPPASWISPSVAVHPLYTNNSVESKLAFEACKQIVCVQRTDRVQPNRPLSGLVGATSSTQRCLESLGL